ncbi:hypothetical protein AAHA92_00497 [Salvia divinorum]|uniref:BHLH domain-containing protein n=1 Tax=Salvia divinorum TaxID=28513 RepID=A0ABD1IMZ5_SALDI
MISTERPYHGFPLSPLSSKNFQLKISNRFTEDFKPSLLHVQRKRDKINERMKTLQKLVLIPARIMTHIYSLFYCALMASQR